MLAKSRPLILDPLSDVPSRHCTSLVLNLRGTIKQLAHLDGGLEVSGEGVLPVARRYLYAVAAHVNVLLMTRKRRN